MAALYRHDVWADPPLPPYTARLAWLRESGAERCPDDTEFRAQVKTFLRSDPFREPAELSILVVIEARASLWHARVYTVRPGSSEPGVRDLDDANDCETATRAAALNVAVTLNHGRIIDPHDPPPALPPPAPPPALPPPPTPRVALTSVRGGVILGVVPGFTPAFGLHAEGTLVGRLRWMAELSTSLAASPEGAEDYSFRLVAARVGACVDLVRIGRLAVPGCASVAAGEVVPTVVRAPVAESGVHPWVGFDLDLGLRVWASRAVFFELGASAGVTALRVQYTDPLNRPGDGAVWDGAWAHGGLWGGAGVSIP